MPIKLFLSLSLSLLMDMTLLGKQHSDPSKPPLARNRYRGQRGRAKQRGDRGFNFRAAAAIVNPSLLDKLPPERGREDLVSGLNESRSPTGLEDDEGSGDA